MKTKTPITCWSCKTVYDYQKHEVCPICENHFLDERVGLQALPPSPVSGTRVSICIDYGRAKLKTLPAVLLALLLVVSSCSRYTCPTYADSGDYPLTIVPVVIEEYDTVVSLKGDTTFLPVPYTPYKGEKVAANTMLFLIGSTIVFSLITENF